MKTRRWLTAKTKRARLAERICLVAAMIMVLFPPYYEVTPGFDNWRPGREKFAWFAPVWATPAYCQIAGEVLTKKSRARVLERER